MRILMVGDVVGRAGRSAVQALVPALREDLAADVVIANGENAAGGFGITPAIASEFFDVGIDVITTGNHVWDQREIIGFLDEEVSLLRPLNYPPGSPGRGVLRRGDLMVVNAMGRVFMQALDDPFRALDGVLEREHPSVVFVDFHCEATSEKQAMGWYLDGRVSALVGTHTHVGTVDARVLPRGTAYVTDVGMVGARDSIIGDTPESVLHRFLTQRPGRLEAATRGPVTFSAVLIDVDEATGLARSIERVDRQYANS